MIDKMAVLAAPLDRVKRNVGAMQQLFFSIPVVRTERDPYRCRNA